MAVKCCFSKRCKYKGISPECMTCSNNLVRNMEEDLYKKAEDKPIPDKCPKITFDGPAEQTAGYQCPVCGKFTNPYMMRNRRCDHCGYLLNV